MKRTDAAILAPPVPAQRWTLTGSWPPALLLTAGQLAVLAVAQTVWLHPAVHLARDAGEVETRSVEGEGDRAGTLCLLPASPIALACGASHLDLFFEAGEEYLSGPGAIR